MHVGYTVSTHLDLLRKFLSLTCAQTIVRVGFVCAPQVELHGIAIGGKHEVLWVRTAIHGDSQDTNAQQL